MLKGVAKILYVYKSSLKRDVFIEKCGKISIKEISRLAKDRKNGSSGYSEALIIFYNKRTKNPLPLDMLYSRVDNVIQSKKIMKTSNESDTLDHQYAIHESESSDSEQSLYAS